MWLWHRPQLAEVPNIEFGQTRPPTRRAALYLTAERPLTRPQALSAPFGSLSGGALRHLGSFMALPITICDGFGFSHRHDPIIVIVHKRNYILRRITHRMRLGVYRFG